MSAKVKVLVTGATGYIGGAILNRFLSRSDAASFDFRAIVRSPDKAEKLRKFGVSTVIGSHNDPDIMVKAASEVDVLIAMADCDDLVAAKLALKGLKKRFDVTGKPPIFINTSGTGVLTDQAMGLYASDTIYNDEDIKQMATIPPSQPHRVVDLAIIDADNAGYIKSYIILPSTIYSIAQSRFVDQGISHPYSQQIPGLIKVALLRGQAGMVGKGKNLWPNVDIHELSDLYSVLYDSIIHNPATGHGREGYYFGASGEHSLLDVAKSIGEVLFEAGKVQGPEPMPFTKEENEKWFRSGMMGSNARCKANRSKAIGWKPVKTTQDMLSSIKPEVEAILKMSPFT